MNATLWAPKFSLPTTSDTEDLVIKWLSIPVLDYLLAGSPPQDYSQDDSLFIKSYQFDSDVGQMFMNFTMHKAERHSHGVRFYHTRNDGSYERQTFYRFNVLLLLVKERRELWNCAMVIPRINRIHSVGK